MERGRVITGIAASVLVAVTVVAFHSGPTVAATPPKAGNPCLSREGREALRCPDLTMRRPFDLWVYRSDGELLLHSANDIQSRGSGPLEVRGRRNERSRMRAHQVIYRRDGSKLHRPASGSLEFHPEPGHRGFWKYEDAARFELWSLDSGGEPLEMVRTGPKLTYCFRDLARTRRARNSPRRRVYPACSQKRSARRATLGVSVGWSDIYSSDYDENWIDIEGLTGCFLFRQVADPLDQLDESSESNNASGRRITLPPEGDSVRSC